MSILSLSRPPTFHKARSAPYQKKNDQQYI